MSNQQLILIFIFFFFLSKCVFVYTWHRQVPVLLRNGLVCHTCTECVLIELNEQRQYQPRLLLITSEQYNRTVGRRRSSHNLSLGASIIGILVLRIRVRNWAYKRWWAAAGTDKVKQLARKKFDKGKNLTGKIRHRQGLSARFPTLLYKIQFAKYNIYQIAHQKCWHLYEKFIYCRNIVFGRDFVYISIEVYMEYLHDDTTTLKYRF